MAEDIKVDRIKRRHTSAGWVVVCLDEGNPMLATHRLFREESAAVAYAETVNPSRLAAVFQLRLSEPDDWWPGRGNGNDR